MESLPKAATPPAAASSTCEGLQPHTPPTPTPGPQAGPHASLVKAALSMKKASAPARDPERAGAPPSRQEVTKSLQSLEDALKALRAAQQPPNSFSGDSAAGRSSEGKLASARQSTRWPMQRRSVTGSEKDLHNRGSTPPRDRTPPRQSWHTGPSPSRVQSTGGDGASTASSVRPTVARATTPPRTVAEHSQAVAGTLASVVRSHERGSKVWRASTGSASGLGAEYSSESRSTTPPRKRGVEDGSALLSGLASMTKNHTARGTAGLPCGGGTMRSAREPPRAAW
jgi:hypothetical protein